MAKSNAISDKCQYGFIKVNTVSEAIIRILSSHFEKCHTVLMLPMETNPKSMTPIVRSITQVLDTTIIHSFKNPGSKTIGFIFQATRSMKLNTCYISWSRDEVDNDLLVDYYLTDGSEDSLDVVNEKMAVVNAVLVKAEKPSTKIKFPSLTKLLNPEPKEIPVNETAL